MREKVQTPSGCQGCLIAQAPSDLKFSEAVGFVCVCECKQIILIIFILFLIQHIFMGHLLNI